MASMEELEGRVSALEAEMRSVRQDAAAARVLAGGADRDVSAFGAKLDAQQRLLEALRETQIEHGRRLAGHDTRFTSLQRRFDGLEQRFDGLEQRFDSLESQMWQGFANLERGQNVILDLLRRRNGHDGEPPA
jgi:chromosome segregation ATPase